MFEKLLELLERFVISQEKIADSLSTSTGGSVLIGATSAVTSAPLLNLVDTTGSIPGSTTTDGGTSEAADEVVEDATGAGPSDADRRKKAFALIVQLNGGAKVNTKVKGFEKPERAVMLLRSGDACRVCSGLGTKPEGGKCDCNDGEASVTLAGIEEPPTPTLDDILNGSAPVAAATAPVTLTREDVRAALTRVQTEVSKEKAVEIRNMFCDKVSTCEESKFQALYDECMAALGGSEEEL